MDDDGIKRKSSHDLSKDVKDSKSRKIDTQPLKDIDNTQSTEIVQKIVSVWKMTGSGPMASQEVNNYCNSTIDTS